MLRIAAALLIVLCIPAPAVGLTIAGVGDSLTSGGDWFRFLPEDWTALDHAQPGEEAWVGLDRFRDDVLPTLDPDDVDVITFLYGTNDVRNYFWGTKDSVTAQKALVLEALDAGFPAVLMGAPLFIDPAGTPEQIDTWNARLEGMRSELAPWAASQGVPYVDLYDAFLAHDDTPSLFERSDGWSDGVHPFRSGRQVVAETAIPAIESVPEPSALSLLASALLAASLRRRAH